MKACIEGFAQRGTRFRTLGEGERYRVYMDGREVKNVVAVDTGAGVLWRVRRDSRGEIVVDRLRDEVAIERVFGPVRVERVSAP